MERLPETCSEIRATLPLFAGYDLEAPEMEAVAAHLESCAECREDCSRARSAREVLGSLRGDPRAGGSADGNAGRDLWPGVRARLVTEGLLVSGPRVARPFAGTRWWLGSVASAAAAVLLVTTFLGRGDEGTAESPARLGALSEVAPVVSTVVSPDRSPEHTTAPETSLAEAFEPESTNTSRPAQGGAASIPAVGSLVGHGAPPVRALAGPDPMDAAQTSAGAGDAGSSFGKLRRLAPGEDGLYEQALLESARYAPVQIQGGNAANRQRRLFGIR